MDPIKPMRVVCAHGEFPDPALDMSKDELAKYREFPERDRLTIKEGATPTWFVLDPIGATCLTAYVQGVDSLLEGYMRGFLASCRKIELPDGAGTMEPDKKQMRTQGRQKVADGEWWDSAAKKLGLDRCYAIGAMASSLSQMAESDRPPT